MVGCRYCGGRRATSGTRMSSRPTTETRRKVHSHRRRCLWKSVERKPRSSWRRRPARTGRARQGGRPASSRPRQRSAGHRPSRSLGTRRQPLCWRMKKTKCRTRESAWNDGSFDNVANSKSKKKSASRIEGRWRERGEEA